MMTKRQLGWRKLFVLLSVLPCCRSLQVTIPEAEYEVASGGDITMTCSFNPARPISNAFVLSWDAYPDTPDGTPKTVATFFINNPVDIAPAYEGRAFLEVDIKNQVSTLRLTKVTMQDNHRYFCNVMIPNDDEGTLTASTSLLVLVPPSVPICNIQGTAEYFQNITLTCRSEQGSPKPESKWQTYSVENIQRQFPPRTTEKDGSLSLFNISREMSGFYICESINRIGSAKCNLTLTVMPPSMNIGSTAAIVGGVLAGVVLLGIIIFCCCRKKGKKEEKAEGYPGEVFYDRDALEAGTEYKDDKPNSETKQHNQQDDNDIVPQIKYSVGTAGRVDDQHSYNSGRERQDAKSDIDSQLYQDDRDHDRRGSRDRLDDKRERHSGSRDRLDNQREPHSGSRDRLDDQRHHYSGSRDRLDDRRDRYGGSHDRLDDHSDRYGGSRDRLDDRRDRYGGSRDRLDDHSDRYHSNRDYPSDRSNRYGGSRDRLDYTDD